jgi:poly(3-hydroxybutyrate) depolymerase
MRYTLLELARASAAPAEMALTTAMDFWTKPWNPLKDTLLGRVPVAAAESVVRLIKPYHKQTFDYGSFEFEGETVTIDETIALHKPFCNLLRFQREGLKNAPKVLFVAAMSGHHATLSKDTFREFLPDHEVYVTDWLDARDVPVSEGRFGFDDYIAYLIEFLEFIGPGVHVIGLCQATVQALAAAAIMSKAGNPCRPRSMALLAGPIDINAAPSKLTRYAPYMKPKLIKPLAIHTVPQGFAGVGREVYPGHLQIGAFMSLNPFTHVKKHLGFFKDVAKGNDEAANRHREFYNEYMTVMDATAEFYLETIDRVFVRRLLPQGQLEYQGELVDCGQIRDVALFTLEGENDDMVALGVTEAAQKLCTHLPQDKREHLVQQGVGHYGIFNGSVYRQEIAPRIKAFIARHHASPAKAKPRAARKRA